VASDISGVSGRAMLEALISGRRDPGALAELTKRRLRTKIRELTEALTGRFTDHPAFLTRLHLDVIVSTATPLPSSPPVSRWWSSPFGAPGIVTIPGFSVLVADVIIAETARLAEILDARSTMTATGRTSARI
jgi:transposase